MHIAFLDANTDRSPFAARHASEVQKFQALMSPVAPDWRYRDFTASEGTLPDSLAGFDGIMISGSPASVNDRRDWVEGLEGVIRAAVSARVPVFGACFGHQAIATALGGTVGLNPQGWVLGRVDTDITANAPWMERSRTETDATPRQAPRALALHAAHTEQVLTPPAGAQVLGGTATTPMGHLAIGNRVFSTQYHPEITAGFMSELIEELAPGLPEPVAARARLSMANVDATGAMAPTTELADEALMALWIARFFAQAQG